MVMNIYSIKDTKVAFQSTWTHHNDETAKREVKIALDKMPEETVRDCELWKIGEWDDQTGIIKSEVKFICKLYDLKGEKDAKL